MTYDPAKQVYAVGSQSHVTLMDRDLKPVFNIESLQKGYGMPISTLLVIWARSELVSSVLKLPIQGNNVLYEFKLQYFICAALICVKCVL